VRCIRQFCYLSVICWLLERRPPEVAKLARHAKRLGMGFLFPGPLASSQANQVPQAQVFIYYHRMIRAAHSAETPRQRAPKPSPLQSNPAGYEPGTTHPFRPRSADSDGHPQGSLPRDGSQLRIQMTGLILSVRRVSFFCLGLSQIRKPGAR